MGQIIIKIGIYLEYVANILTQKKNPCKKTSVRKKNSEGKNQLKRTSQVLLNIKLVDK